MTAAIILILTAVLFRVLPPLLHVHHDWMSNFSPLASIVFCGALFFPKKLAFWVPFVVMAVSDFILNLPALFDAVPLLPRALEISQKFRQTVYDCLYVALAEREGCELVTADDKLIKAVQPTMPFVVSLASL